MPCYITKFNLTNDDMCYHVLIFSYLYSDMQYSVLICYNKKKVVSSVGEGMAVGIQDTIYVFRNKLGHQPIIQHNC